MRVCVCVRECRRSILTGRDFIQAPFLKNALFITHAIFSHLAASP